MNRKLFFCLFTLLPFCVTLADNSNFRDWDSEDVVGIYIEITKYEASQNGFDESYNDGYTTRYFEKVKVEEGLYEIELNQKIDSKFWSIMFSNLFIKFRYYPILLMLDEGILDWDGYSGVFYKEP
jgi:hypothetical protein